MTYANVPTLMRHGILRVTVDDDGTAAWEYPDGTRAWADHYGYAVRVYTATATFREYVVLDYEDPDAALDVALARYSVPACADVSEVWHVPDTDEAIFAGLSRAVAA